MQSSVSTLFYKGNSMQWLHKIAQLKINGYKKNLEAKTSKLATNKMLCTQRRWPITWSYNDLIRDLLPSTHFIENSESSLSHRWIYGALSPYRPQLRSDFGQCALESTMHENVNRRKKPTYKRQQCLARHVQTARS